MVDQPLEKLKSETAEVVRRWADTPYYDAAEKYAQGQWNNLIQPFLSSVEIDYSTTLELAVGHGRMTAILLEHAKRVIGVDVLEENIAYCALRFADVDHLELIRNDGVTLDGVASGSVSFVFCFDSMIHFDSDVVRAYLKEFARVLRPGGHAFLHHSNLTRNPGGDFQRNVHARNFMSIPMFSHYAQKEGLQVLKQKAIDWGPKDKRVVALDGLALLQAPEA
ncbi:class I SAM-dependent methyltransferase [Roseibaca sp. Y0-43]|uniref:class I SAM-dependent methyltransferase n=1 Tax=Roseibaca sp. Y0-43 TaxID=2816854 RepID=UPI001D0C148A|nr:class I SAM-dependent methyltransferase [Roseibaca sp. Y0-43]MCC1482863.1 class I SAM-dependent methyltransferase [Roseibaca sp. Y0-43]